MCSCLFIFQIRITFNGFTATKEMDILIFKNGIKKTRERAPLYSCIYMIMTSYENLSANLFFKKFWQNLVFNDIVKHYRNQHDYSNSSYYTIRYKILPVRRESGNCRCHSAITIATKIETPITTWFLLDLNSISWNADTPMEHSTPVIARDIPPKAGAGTDVITAPNLPSIPNTVARIPAITNTILLCI